MNGSHQVILDGDGTVNIPGTLTVPNLTGGKIITASPFDDITGFYGQSNIPVIQNGTNGSIDISSVGVVTISNQGRNYTDGIAIIGGGTRILITTTLYGWIFNPDGSVTFPDNTTQNTAFTYAFTDSKYFPLSGGKLNGNIGINNDPLYFNIDSVNIGNSYGDFGIGSSNNIIINPNENLILTENIGNVGIGTITPTTKLDVNGVITVTGGNSDQWNNVYSSVNTNSATNWNYQGTDIKSLTSNWQNTYNNFNLQSGNNISVYNNVNTNSATNWNYQGTDIKALTANWQNTYSTVSSFSALWGRQTLSFNESNAQLTISDGNTVSLSALSGGIGSSGVSYLSALNDVYIPSPVNGQVLTYSSVLQKWTTGSPASASGATGYYGSFYDTTAQTLTGANQAKRLDIANTFEANGVSLSGNKIVFNNFGVYEIIFSIQYKNTDASQHDIYVWFRKNGIDVPDSSSVFTIPARKSAGIPAQLIAVTPFIATLAANDFIEIYWHCNTTAVTVETFTTHSNPTIPDTPGVIITVKQVTNVQLVPTVGAYLPLSGGNVTGVLSSTNVIYASGGNSNQWNNTYSTVQTNSGSWSGGIRGTVGTTDNAITRADGTGGSTLTGSLVTIADDGTLTKAEAYELGQTGTGYGRIGLWDADNTQWMYFNANSSKIIFPDIVADSFTGPGNMITQINAGNISTGTLGVTRGGTGANTLSANALLVGNGTSNILSVANSFVSGGAITLGNTESLSTTPTAYLTLRNTTPALSSATVQVSPSFVLEGQGWKTNATAASQTVRFRQNVLPVQGTDNPSAIWKLQSEINNSNIWNDRLTVASNGDVNIPSLSGGGIIQSVGGVLSPFAPGVVGNMLISDGTNWTRSYTLTLGIADGLGTTSAPRITVRNTTAATAILTQVSPSIVLEGRGYASSLSATQIVRFRENILPVQGTTNPSATWRLQSEINNSGTFTDRMTVDSAGGVTLPGSVVTTSSPVLNLTQTWSNSAVAFTGSVFNIVNTNSSSSSVIQEWQVNGVRSLALQADAFGRISGSTINSGFTFNGQSANRMAIYAGGSMLCYLTPSDFGLRGNAMIRWDSTGGDPNSTGNGLSIMRDNQNHILGQRVSANPQTSNVYNTYTDTSNFERGFSRWRGSQFTATISGTTMTLTVAAVGTFAVGQRIAGTGVTAGTVINSLASGTLGAVGSTYIVSVSQTVATATVMNSYSDVYEIGTEKGSGGGTARAMSLVTDGVERMNIAAGGAISIASSLLLPKTITTAGTTGARTINQPSGSVNFAAAATSLVVTNSLVTVDSVIQVSKATNDATARLGAVVAGAGSFTIYMDVAPTAETRVNFLITN